MSALRAGSTATNAMSQAPVLPASTTLPAASNTMSWTGTPSRLPSSRARSTEMPVGSPPGAAGRAASTALPTLIAARSVPLGARSETAAAGGFCGMDVQAPRRNKTPINAARMSPPHVFRLLEVRRRVDHHHAHLFPRHEPVRHVGREEAGLARPHREFLAADLDVGAPLEQVAHLLD